jgi:hypothetical protein
MSHQWSIPRPGKYGASLQKIFICLFAELIIKVLYISFSKITFISRFSREKERGVIIEGTIEEPNEKKDSF